MKKHLQLVNQNLIPSLVGLLVLLSLYWASTYSYLLFHSLAELFSIGIAFILFVVYWNGKDLFENNYLIFISIAYLFVGSLDLVHTLAYKGMGVFPEFDANLPTQLWIAARYLESLSLFCATFFLRRKFQPKRALLVYAGILIAILAAIFAGGIFPDCYVEGIGLTRFKVASEYIIAVILLATWVRLYQKRNQFATRILRLLMLALVLTIGSELAFTFYTNVYGFSNFIGHILKIASFYLIYRSLIQTGLGDHYLLVFGDLKRQENELRKQRDQAQLYLDIAGVMFIALDARGRVMMANRKACQVLQIDEENLLGRDWFEHCVPENVRNDVRNIYAQLMSGNIETVEFYENEILTASGEERLIAWHNSILYDETGSIIGSISSGEDITERKQAENALIENEKLLRTIAEHYPNSYLSIIEDDFTVGFSSGQEFKRQNLNPEHFYGLPIEQVFGNHTPIVREHYQKTFKGEERAFELFINGQYQYYRTVPLYANDGSIPRILTVVENVSERKRAERKLRESHERLITILNSIDADVYVSDMETYEILFTNQHMQTHFGNNVVGKACWKVFRGNSGPCTHCTNNQLIDADGNFSEVVIWENKNPITGKWYINYDRAIQWIDGRIVRLQVATDITERILAEEALQESQRRLSTLMNNLPGMAYRCMNDPNWTMNFVSDGCLSLTGYKPDELIDNSRLSFAEIIHPEDRQIVWDTVQDGLEAKRSFQLTYRIITANKNVKWVWEQGQSILGAENEMIALEGFITDISDQVQAEDTLKRYTAQLETLNTIATALSTSLELDNVLELILDQIGKVIPFDSGAIFLYEDTGLRVMVDRNLTRSPRGHLFPAEDELFAEIRQTRVPLILNNPKADPRFKNWGHSEDIACWMGVPLIVRDTLIGFLTLDSNQPEAYSSEQAEISQPFASQAAQAIENARLYARVIQDTNEMERRVQERTEELQNFVNLTAGREVRMAELKRTITKLRTQLEKAGITPIANDPLLESVELTQSSLKSPPGNQARGTR